MSKEEISLKGLNERQKKAIEHIKKKEKITREIYCSINDIGNTHAKKELNELIIRKIIKRMGKGKNTHYVLVTE